MGVAASRSIFCFVAALLVSLGTLVEAVNVSTVVGSSGAAIVAMSCLSGGNLF
jgi:hypothetical protein